MQNPYDSLVDISVMYDIEKIVNELLAIECPGLKISLSATIADENTVVIRAVTKQRPNWWQRIRWAILGD